MTEAARLLRYARGRAGLTQRGLAAKAGVPQSSVARIEASRGDPTVASLSRLPRACGTTLEALPGSGEGVDRTLFPLDRTPAERMADAQGDPLRLLRFLGEHEVGFVLVGDRAVALHADCVAAADVDACHDTAPDNLDRLAAALRALNAVPRDGGDASPDALRGNGVVRLATDLGPLDLVATPSGTAGYDDLLTRATTWDLGGVAVAVAGVEDLVRMKTAVGRLKDRLAVEVLRASRHAVR